MLFRRGCEEPLRPGLAAALGSCLLPELVRVLVLTRVGGCEGLLLYFLAVPHRSLVEGIMRS